MNKTTILVERLYTVGKFILPGAILLGLFQIPATPATNSMPASVQSIMSRTLGRVEVINHPVATEYTTLPMNEIFFGTDMPVQVAQAKVDKQVSYVSSRKAYPASLAVVQKHAETIKQKANENNVPVDVAVGVALLENGGSDTAVSPAGALGVFQLMPGTARSLGLQVDKKADDRKNPAKNIDAGVRYLRSNYDRFGDWGLATWAYHAGEGNVSKAIKIYAKAHGNVKLAGVGKPSEMKAYVEKSGLTVHKLLNDPKVKEFTSKLNDDSEGYPFKVVATATLFKEANKAKEVVKK